MGVLSGALELLVDLVYVGIGRGHKHEFVQTAEQGVLSAYPHSFHIYACSDENCYATKCRYDNKKVKGPLLSKYGRVPVVEKV